VPFLELVADAALAFGTGGRRWAGAPVSEDWWKQYDFRKLNDQGWVDVKTRGWLDELHTQWLTGGSMLEGDCPIKAEFDLKSW